MNGLLLHCGAKLSSREEIIAVPTPQATESYVPLSYESLLTRIEKQLAVESILIKDEKLALSKNGQRLFGMLELKMPGLPMQDYGCILGLRNSYDKSCSTGICLGASVFVCDNLSFNGEVTFSRKHTANLLRDLSWIISETVNQLPTKFASQSRLFENYKATEMSDEAAHDVVIRFLDAGAINVTDIPRILKEWRAPRHPEFAQNGKNAWRLFNACTEVLKGSGLWLLPDRTEKIHNVLDAEVRSDEFVAEGDMQGVIIA
jgi:hypothetical protein